jgi:hypothetical protein
LEGELLDDLRDALRQLKGAGVYNDGSDHPGAGHRRYTLLAVLFFALGMSVLTGVIFGIAPAWMTSHADPVEALRGANRSVGGQRSWAQKSLVVGQAAMSLVLLSSAALLGQSLRNLEHQSFGFETQDRYIAWINPLLANYPPEQMEPLFRQKRGTYGGTPERVIRRQNSL